MVFPWFLGWCEMDFVHPRYVLSHAPPMSKGMSMCPLQNTHPASGWWLSLHFSGGPKSVHSPMPGISLGLGMSAATGLVHHSFCGGPQSIPTPIGDIKCGGSVAASFTLFCNLAAFLVRKLKFSFRSVGQLHVPSCLEGYLLDNCIFPLQYQSNSLGVRDPWGQRPLGSETLGSEPKASPLTS